MDQTPTEQALSRIGSSVARLERALDRTLFEPAAAASNPDEGLADRHQALRQSVSATLGELDKLIGSLER